MIKVIITRDTNTYMSIDGLIGKLRKVCVMYTENVDVRESNT